MNCYIRIKAHLDPSWQEWMEGLQIIHEEGGTSLLCGRLPDQAALFGVLLKLRELDLNLLSLETNKES